MSKQSSVGLTKENHELLKTAAAKRGVSMTNYVNSLIEQVGVADKEEKVILSIPMVLTRRNKDALRQWLQARLDALVEAYYPEKTRKSNVFDVTTN